MTIIALAGLARSGKDTAGKMLAKELGWETYALASPIKSAVNSLFGFDERHSDGVLKEEELYTKVYTREEVDSVINRVLCNHPDYEELDLEKLALEFHKVFSEFIVFSKWNSSQLYISPRKAYQLFGTEWGRDEVDDDIWTSIAPCDSVIWTDCRFLNEAVAVKSLGGIIIQLENVKQKIISSSGHSSEAGLPEGLIDYVVKNPMTKKGLKKALLEVVSAENYE